MTAVTQSVLGGNWSLEDIQDYDFSHENMRVALFYKLLESTDSVDQIIILHKLLVEWSSLSEYVIKQNLLLII